jgi:quercetin dioxygenase-like cupin family protein
MITEQQQEQASLYVLGALTGAEQEAFGAELRGNAELREFVFTMQQTTGLLAMATPLVKPRHELKVKVLRRIETATGQEYQSATRHPDIASAGLAGLRFLNANDTVGWKQLPVIGAWIKLLSIERERGYAVLLGKLDPGVRYPAHTNAGPEDFYVLTGDLHVGDRTMRAGDFHHADAGSLHGENYSVEGCTLVAVLTSDHPLVDYAMS